ncbi:MAG: hypothetical protein HXX81_01375 [Campylobacterales bacterium]|nr:hypothetical protein [Campylobacterales bacterium]
MKLKFDFDVKKLFQSKNKLIFLDKQPISFPIEDKCDIILSPAFYWIKKEKLPVKYEYQAKPFAESIFDGTIPTGTYNYFAVKHENEFLMFAYDDSYILNKISELGIKSSQIDNIYFAQTEFLNYSAIRINHHEALLNNDGIIVNVPIELVDEYIDIYDVLKNIKPSKHSVALSRFSQILDEKSFNTILVIIFLLILSVFANYYILKQEQKKQLLESQKIYELNNLPTSSFQIESIIGSLKSVSKEQIKTREMTKELFSTQLNSNEYFLKTEFKNKRFNIKIFMNEPKRAEYFKEQFGKKFKIYSMKVNDNILNTELGYE